MTNAEVYGTRSLHMTASSNSPVGIVVVNYNTYADTARCLQSLRALNYAAKEIFCVDNASTDNSLSLLRKEFGAAVIFLESPKNGGFAAGCNIGIRAALERDMRFVWLVNSDAQCLPDALTPLVMALEQQPEVAATGSKILFGEISQATQRIWSAGGYLNIAERVTEMRGYGEVDTGQYDIPACCDYLPGCSICIRSEVFGKVGFLPEEYFMYFEETAWCLSVRRSEGMLCYVPKSVVLHFTDEAKAQTPFMIYYYNRNSLLFWYRATELFSVKFSIILQALRALLRSSYALFRAPIGELKTIFKAHVRANLHFLIGRYGKQPSN